jgi:predicted ATPase
VVLRQVLIDQLYNSKCACYISAAVPLADLFARGGAAGGAEAAAEAGLAQLEGLEFEGEAGKARELNPIGVTANRLAAEA